jgi:hypothetical protein
MGQGQHRPQQHHLTWPLTPSQVENVDTMFTTLFRQFKKLLVSVGQITGILPVVNGGTGLDTIEQGDLYYGSAHNVVSRLAKSTSATRSLTNTGPGNNPAWDQVNLSNGVKNRLPYANIVQAVAASKLLGRGDSGAGDWQEITLGTNLSMSGTTLNATGGGAGTNYAPLTNGDPAFPELVFDGSGDVIMVPF